MWQEVVVACSIDDAQFSLEADYLWDRASERLCRALARMRRNGAARLVHHCGRRYPFLPSLMRHRQPDGGAARNRRTHPLIATPDALISESGRSIFVFDGGAELTEGKRLDTWEDALRREIGPDCIAGLRAWLARELADFLRVLPDRDLDAALSVACEVLDTGLSRGAVLELVAQFLDREQPGRFRVVPRRANAGGFEVRPLAMDGERALQFLLCEHWGLAAPRVVVAGVESDASALCTRPGWQVILPRNANRTLRRAVRKRRAEDPDVYHAHAPQAQGLLEGLAHFDLLEASLPELPRNQTPAPDQDHVGMVLATYRKPGDLPVLRYAGVLQAVEQLMGQQFAGTISLAVVDSSPEPHPFFAKLPVGRFTTPDGRRNLLFIHLPSRNRVSAEVRERFPAALDLLPNDAALLDEDGPWLQKMQADLALRPASRGQALHDRPTTGFMMNFGAMALKETFGRFDWLGKVDDDDCHGPTYVQRYVQAMRAGGYHFARLASYLVRVWGRPGAGHWGAYWLPLEASDPSRWQVAASARDALVRMIASGHQAVDVPNWLYFGRINRWPALFHDGCLHMYDASLWEQSLDAFLGYPTVTNAEDCIYLTNLREHFGASLRTAPLYLDPLEQGIFVRGVDGQNTSCLVYHHDVDAQDVPGWAHESFALPDAIARYLQAAPPSGADGLAALMASLGEGFFSGDGSSAADWAAVLREATRTPARPQPADATHVLAL